MYINNYILELNAHLFMLTNNFKTKYCLFFVKNCVKMVKTFSSELFPKLNPD